MRPHIPTILVSFGNLLIVPILSVDRRFELDWQSISSTHKVQLAPRQRILIWSNFLSKWITKLESVGNSSARLAWSLFLQPHYHASTSNVMAQTSLMDYRVNRIALDELYRRKRRIFFPQRLHIHSSQGLLTSIMPPISAWLTLIGSICAWEKMAARTSLHKLSRKMMMYRFNTEIIHLSSRTSEYVDSWSNHWSNFPNFTFTLQAHLSLVRGGSTRGLCSSCDSEPHPIDGAVWSNRGIFNIGRGHQANC